MTDNWPRWATVRAEQVRTLLPQEEWGPWTQGGSCSRGIPPVFGFQSTLHQSEPPYFFHCNRCMDAIRAAQPAPPPHPRRDLGLCITCGKPAAPLDRIVRVDAAAAQLAEERGVTIARVSTKRYCANCSPKRLPWCRSTVCAKTKGRHKALPLGCCPTTKSKRSPHCQDACDRVKAQTKAAYQRQQTRASTKSMSAPGPKCTSNVCHQTKGQHDALQPGCCTLTRPTNKHHIGPHCQEACQRGRATNAKSTRVYQRAHKGTHQSPLSISPQGEPDNAA